MEKIIRIILYIWLNFERLLSQYNKIIHTALCRNQENLSKNVKMKNYREGEKVIFVCLYKFILKLKVYMCYKIYLNFNVIFLCSSGINNSKQ